jgi:arylsulfatase A-like enzyme
MLTRRQLLAAPSLLQGQRRFPNVLWLMTDEQRPDSLGCYRGGGAHSPHLDSLAAEGTLFENAYTPSPVCVACRSALITGNSASTNGVLHNQARLRPGSTPLTWRFEDAGYQTATFGKKHYFLPGKRPVFQTEAGMITDKFVEPENYAKGFNPADYDVLQYAPAPTQKEKRRWILAGKFPVGEDQSAEARNVALAIDWLSRRDGAKPFFLRVSFNAPHTPAVTPAQYLALIDPKKIDIPFPSEAELASQPKRESVLLRGFQGTQRMTREEIQKARHYYYARVSFADAMMGRLIGWMKDRQLLDNTIVVFVSDHGSHLGDHGMLQKQTFYEQVATVPYFYWRKGLGRRGVRLKIPVNILSLLPTLLELAGLPHQGAEGRSLAAEVSKGVEPRQQPIFSEIAFGYQGYRDADRQVMMRDGRYKLSLFPDSGDPDGALYDLARDPNEARNLYADPKHRGLVAKLRERIYAWDRTRAEQSRQRFPRG